MLLHEPRAPRAAPLPAYPPACSAHLITLRPGAQEEALARASTIGVMLGSFDPPHVAHEWIAGQLLERAEAVLLLIPTQHFSKRIDPPDNATFSQRLEMLEATTLACSPKVTAGLTRAVLFVDLWVRLGSLFPHASVTFAMGSETFRKTIDSRRYAQRLGICWTRDRQQQLEHVLATTLVVARGDCPVESSIKPPAPLRHLSSTTVRRTISELWTRDPSGGSWSARLASMVSPGIVPLVHSSGLYRPTV